MTPEPRLEIGGRPSEEEAAAILAAVAALLAEQRSAGAKPPPRPTVSAWVRTVRGPRLDGVVPGVDATGRAG